MPGIGAGATGAGGLIHARGLVKHFKVAPRRPGLLGALRGLASREAATVRAVDGIDLDVAAGELVGYLGPNGAGKSTTLKMLTGILVPTAGEVRVAGHVPWADRVAYTRRIGVVFGQRTNLWWDLPTQDSLELLRHVYQVPADRFRRNLRVFDDLLELGAFMHTPVRQLSLGQRMRADLAAALLHDPDLVFLDEPTIGLDVVAKGRIREFIRSINAERGVTVMLTTHDLGDVEKLCRRVVVIAGGRLLFDGTLEGLHARFGHARELVVDFDADYAEVPLDGATVVARDGRRVTYRFARGTVSASELIRRLVDRYRVADLTVREPDIEAVIRPFYEGGAGAARAGR